MRPTLELLDLLDQVRELMRVELSLVRDQRADKWNSIQAYSGRCWGRSSYRRPRSYFGCGQPVSFALRNPSRPGVPNYRRGCDHGKLAAAAFECCGPETLALSPCQEHIANLFVVWRALAWA